MARAQARPVQGGPCNFDGPSQILATIFSFLSKVPIGRDAYAIDQLHVALTKLVLLLCRTCIMV